MPRSYNRTVVAGRRTNLALLLLLVVGLITGGLAFAIGAEWARWVVAAHGAAGLAILLLAPWKSVVVRRGLRRARTGRCASVVLAALVVLVTATGVLHATGTGLSFGPVDSMQVHVAAALACTPLAAWHVLTRRTRPRRTDLSRRTLLRAGALGGGAVAAYAATEGMVRIAGLPGSRRRFTGSHERGTGRPQEMPVTQWLDDSVPSIEPAGWRLAVRGGDGRERELAAGDLEVFEDRVRATLDCTGGWFAEQDWDGVRLDRLLGELGGARSIAVVSATGYSRRFPARDAAALLLATRVAGGPLSPGHGFPARIVAPGRRGFWWVKWVVRIEASSTPWWWQPPFPLT